MKTRTFFSCVVLFGMTMPAFAMAQSQNCPSFASDLHFGQSGSSVTELQTFLKAGGHLLATPNGQFGPATLAAVRSFQRAGGVVATGVVGPLTRAAIRASCASSGSPSSGPTTSSGAFEVTGWIPYWRSATGTADVLPHLSQLTEVNPFTLTLKSDGTIVDNGKMDREPWLSFIAAAKAKKVRVIPTLMSGDGDMLHKLLSNSKTRIALEDRIAAYVKQNGYDGIDIDFEGKKAATKDYFSTFLKGLYQRMGNKWVMCTIESRTPISSRYYGAEVPPDAEVYANDLVAINKYCDRVRVMTYDQQGIDLQLSDVASSKGQVYAPVADPVWVKKVITLMSKSISKKKLLIGVPTYGYEYEVTAYANNEYTYKIKWTFNQGYGKQIGAQYGVSPDRNTAGELYLTYMPANANAAPATFTGNAALTAAVSASTVATTDNTHATFRLLDWPDAVSIAQKVALAKELGVRGISIFKLDGGEDPNIWTIGLPH